MKKNKYNETENEKQITYIRHRPRPKHGHIYTEYEICLSKMMVFCVKLHLSNI